MTNGYMLTANQMNKKPTRNNNNEHAHQIMEVYVKRDNKSKYNWHALKTNPLSVHCSW